MTGDVLAGPEAGRTEGPVTAGGVLDPGSGGRSPVILLDEHRRTVSATDVMAWDQNSDTPTLLRVLVIDDEEEDFLIVRELLARAEHGQFRVEHAADAEAGLDRLLGGRCDVALVDYRLAGQDGLSLVRLAVRRGVTAPVILMSGLGVPDLAMDAITAGAVDFLERRSSRSSVSSARSACRWHASGATRNGTGHGGPNRRPACPIRRCSPTGCGKPRPGPAATRR
jgi:CheY-like chemotaxis protein